MKKPAPPDNMPVTFDPDSILLHRLIGQQAFLILEKDQIEKLTEAVACNRKSSFLERVEADKREKASMANIVDWSILMESKKRGNMALTKKGK